jgi:alkylation response protein AidB-like acyl-CoA dehydrogenase
MQFAFTEDQLLFRDTVAEFFANECPPEKVRWSWDDTVGRDASTWAAQAEMEMVTSTRVV